MPTISDINGWNAITNGGSYTVDSDIDMSSATAFGFMNNLVISGAQKPDGSTYRLYNIKKPFSNLWTATSR
jgi:hypothetical protein